MYWGKSGYSRAKVVVFEQICCNWAKWVVFGQKFLYSGKSSCNRESWLYSVKIGCISANMIIFGQGGCIRKKWL